MKQIIAALLMIPLFLLLAVAIFGQFSQNVDRTSWSNASNTTYDKVVNQTWAGFNLAALLPYVMIAMAIVGAVIGGMYLFGK